MRKWIYTFDDHDERDKALLGGKGANLAAMTRAGLPVPPGFTMTTEACTSFVNNGKRLTSEMLNQLKWAVGDLEIRTGKGFGDSLNPLLVSVRSGAPISMPGMMDTILNLGLNDVTVESLALQTSNPRFAYDSFRRFIQMFGNVVLGIPSHAFEEIIERKKRENNMSTDQSVTANVWKSVIVEQLELVEIRTGREFPMDPYEQLTMAVEAVFMSWYNPRAAVYRRVHHIPETLGTAVNVQSMVFGNLGETSGTGVAFTRNPSTGERVVFGEYLTNAQGEDVVAGVRTPQPIAKLEIQMPDVYHRLMNVCTELENHFQDVQDIEFTVELGTLYLLQTRNAKRSAAAATKIVVDLVEEGIIDKQTALMRTTPEQLMQLMHPSIDETRSLDVIATGLPASPGAATGQIVLDADKAEDLAKTGVQVLLVSQETTPEDIHGIIAAEGVLTSRGGMTSHAAVVARGMGKPCVCGCDAMVLNFSDRTVRIGDRVFTEGDVVSIDGGTGRVIAGAIELIEPQMSESFTTLMSWADDIRVLGVYANADTPEDAEKARAFGAEGIGLCRTEHMFMGADRLPIVQDMILADNDRERSDALAKLLPVQREDFYGILKAMDGLPVIIRLLDPPLHEFLPDIEELIERRTRLLAEGNSADRLELETVETLLSNVRRLHEANPMLGHRGCRLGMTMPEIYEMQVQAVLEATSQLVKDGLSPKPEIMIPLVGHVEELRRMRTLVQNVQTSLRFGSSVAMSVPIGTMIEVPRAALTASDIAKEADFFSFGTNDLTQTTFGYSRDDAEGKFLARYVDDEVLHVNPFASIDTEGVGQLVEMAVHSGRAEKPALHMGVCGEHAGDKDSISFFHETGLDYVSCSPYRVPTARLAAAQSEIAHPHRQALSVSH